MVWRELKIWCLYLQAGDGPFQASSQADHGKQWFKKIKGTFNFLEIIF